MRRDTVLNRSVAVDVREKMSGAGSALEFTGGHECDDDDAQFRASDGSHGRLEIDYWKNWGVSACIVPTNDDDLGVELG